MKCVSCNGKTGDLICTPSLGEGHAVCLLPSAKTNVAPPSLRLLESSEPGAQHRRPSCSLLCLCQKHVSDL